MTRAARIWWVLWLGYAALWTFALLTPRAVDVRDAVIPEEFGFTAGKALHVAAYAVFAVLSSRLPPRWLLLGVVVLHAPASEFLQQFTGRTASWEDALIDLVGMALGVAVTWKSWWGVTPKT